MHDTNTGGRLDRCTIHARAKIARNLTVCQAERRRKRFRPPAQDGYPAFCKTDKQRRIFARLRASRYDFSRDGQKAFMWDWIQRGEDERLDVENDQAWEEFQTRELERQKAYIATLSKEEKVAYEAKQFRLIIYPELVREERVRLEKLAQKKELSTLQSRQLEAVRSGQFLHDIEAGKVINDQELVNDSEDSSALDPTNKQFYSYPSVIATSAERQKFRRYTRKNPELSTDQIVNLIKNSRKHITYPSAVTTSGERQKYRRDIKPALANEPVINDHEPVINDHEPVINDHEPVINDHEPVINDHEPVINDHEPVINDHEPVINDHEPVINDHEPVINDHEPVINDQLLRLAFLFPIHHAPIDLRACDYPAEADNHRRRFIFYHLTNTLRLTPGEARVALREDFIEPNLEFDLRVEEPYQAYLRTLSPSPLTTIDRVSVLEVRISELETNIAALAHQNDMLMAQNSRIIGKLDEQHATLKFFIDMITGRI